MDNGKRTAEWLKPSLPRGRQQNDILFLARLALDEVRPGPFLGALVIALLTGLFCRTALHAAGEYLLYRAAAPVPAVFSILLAGKCPNARIGKDLSFFFLSVVCGSFYGTLVWDSSGIGGTMLHRFMGE